MFRLQKQTRARQRPGQRNSAVAMTWMRAVEQELNKSADILHQLLPQIWKASSYLLTFVRSVLLFQVNPWCLHIISSAFPLLT